VAAITFRSGRGTIKYHKDAAVGHFITTSSRIIKIPLTANKRHYRDVSEHEVVFTSHKEYVTFPEIKHTHVKSRLPVRVIGRLFLNEQVKLAFGKRLQTLRLRNEDG
jgi:hypothetical protein